jgi:hypothetical protein
MMAFDGIDINIDIHIYNMKQALPATCGSPPPWPGPLGGEGRK